MEREMKNMCPNCASKETGSFIKKQPGIDELLDLNKCHECNCTFLTFDLNFESIPEVRMAV